MFEFFVSFFRRSLFLAKDLVFSQSFSDKPGHSEASADEWVYHQGHGGLVRIPKSLYALSIRCRGIKNIKMIIIWNPRQILFQKWFLKGRTPGFASGDFLALLKGFVGLKNKKLGFLKQNPRKAKWISRRRGGDTSSRSWRQLRSHVWNPQEKPGRMDTKTCKKCQEWRS